VVDNDQRKSSKISTTTAQMSVKSDSKEIDVKMAAEVTLREAREARIDQEAREGPYVEPIVPEKSFFAKDQMAKMQEALKSVVNTPNTPVHDKEGAKKIAQHGLIREFHMIYDAPPGVTPHVTYTDGTEGGR
jgi:hypothetical protein